jgi:hypothetical protein
VNSGAAARKAQTDVVPLDRNTLAATPVAITQDLFEADTPANDALNPLRAMTVLLVVPTLNSGAAEAGVADLVRILTAGGHRAIVMSRGGRLEEQITKAGGTFVYANLASKNPLVMVCNIAAILRTVRQYNCEVIHAHGRAPGWSAYAAARLAGIPFVTSWYKGFREQNVLKRLYNSVMARGDRIIAVSDQLADLVRDRYRVPAPR